MAELQQDQSSENLELVDVEHVEGVQHADGSSNTVNQEDEQEDVHTETLAPLQEVENAGTQESELPFRTEIPGDKPASDTDNTQPNEMDGQLDTTEPESSTTAGQTGQQATDKPTGQGEGEGVESCPADPAGAQTAPAVEAESDIGQSTLSHDTVAASSTITLSDINPEGTGLLLFSIPPGLTAVPEDFSATASDGALEEREKWNTVQTGTETSTSYTYEEARLEDYAIPGFKAIDVEVDQGPGLPHKMVRVLIDTSQQERKLYLGGFRDKHTGDIYHHMTTQTPRQPKYSVADRKHSRQTQTVYIKTRSQQTFREAATQMQRPGLLLNTAEDRLMTPRAYQTADEVLAIRLAAVIVIQRYTRGWFARRRASHLRHMKAERDAFLQDQDLRRQMDAEEHRKHEIERRLHPRQAADFEVLFNELEAWRLQETRRIKEGKMNEEQTAAALQQLLHKETKLLQTIDRLKITANQQNKESRIQRTLRDMSKPKQWDLNNGNKVLVHTPFTTRAKELMQLYNGLNLLGLTVDERLDVLLHVKWTVKEFDCNLTRELVELIDREADLLNRGRHPKTLEGLRKRISTLFLAFIETPEFNPEAQAYQIVTDSKQEDYIYKTLGLSSARPEPVSFGVDTY